MRTFSFFGYFVRERKLRAATLCSGNTLTKSRICGNKLRLRIQKAVYPTKNSFSPNIFGSNNTSQNFSEDHALSMPMFLNSILF